MSRTVSLQALKEISMIFPESYYEDVLKHSVDLGNGRLEMSDQDYEYIQNKYKGVPQQAPSPSLIEMSANFTGAMVRWVKLGFPVVQEEVFQKRLEICRGCQFWDEDARFGFGKCQKCGCGKTKMYLATESCPLGKWNVPEKYFDRVVLINLKRRPERYAATMKMIEEMKDWPFPMPERFEAIDAEKIPTPIGWPDGGGAWGCMQSHRQVLERAMMDGVENLLVLEDDVVFVENFAKQVVAFMQQVPDDWEQIMFGGQLFGNSKNEQVKPGIIRVADCHRTHCYAVRGQYMRDLYSKWCSSYGHCDHVMGPLQRDRMVYAPDPFIAGQREGWSDISGADNPAKLWVAPDSREPIYWVKSKERRAVEELRRSGYHGGRNRNPQGIDIGLDKIVKSTATEEVKIKRLQAWITMVQWEARAMTPAHKAMLWHPDITEELIKSTGITTEII